MKTIKTIFIPAKFRAEVNKAKILRLSKSLPENLAIAYSIQFQDIANEIKSLFTRQGKAITAFMQVLGCSKPKFPKETKAVLLISTGKFHAISLAYESKLPIYILDRNKLEKITEKDLEIIKTKQKAAYMRFLNANEVGILASTKPGQQRLKKALELRSKLANSKKSYVFLSNAINIGEFENFPNIDTWVNTACPRLDMDNPDSSSAIINIDKLKE